MRGGPLIYLPWLLPEQRDVGLDRPGLTRLLGSVDSHFDAASAREHGCRILDQVAPSASPRVANPAPWFCGDEARSPRHTGPRSYPPLSACRELPDFD